MFRVYIIMVTYEIFDLDLQIAYSFLIDTLQIDYGDFTL